ncbi:hypothetical protein Tco_1115530 [Tanacetum coccineum]
MGSRDVVVSTVRLLALGVRGRVIELRVVSKSVFIVRIYSLGSTSGIRACCEALNKKKQKQYTLDQFLSVKIEARTTTTTLTARLPILNPRDYDLWLMRIEQYFIMTDYSLWEVIKNGNKVLKKTVRETQQEYGPTTAEEK